MCECPCFHPCQADPPVQTFASPPAVWRECRRRESLKAEWTLRVSASRTPGCLQDREKRSAYPYLVMLSVLYIDAIVGVTKQRRTWAGGVTLDVSYNHSLLKNTVFNDF